MKVINYKGENWYFSKPTREPTGSERRRMISHRHSTGCDGDTIDELKGIFFRKLICEKCHKTI